MEYTIDKSSNTAFAEYVIKEPFDELIELDLFTGQGKWVYSAKQKYDVPEISGGIKDVVLKMLRDLIHPEDGEAYLAFWNESNMAERILASPSKMISAEFRQKSKDGHWSWVRQKLTFSQPREGEKPVVLCFIKDIDEEKAQVEEILSQTEHLRRVDRLTGLLRTKAFFDEVDAFSKSNSTDGYAMMAIDIEHFKLFNEWYGWERGDKYLTDIATRLNAVVTVIGGFAGYFGADNFAVFMKQRPEYVDHMMAEIDEYVNRKEDLTGFIPNMGVYFVDENEKVSASAMYDRAVLALNTVRGIYSKRYNVYDPSMFRELGREMSVLTEVKKGIEEREFVVYMQPQVDVSSGKIVGAESLVRWKSKEKGMISPAYFIPVLEKDGFITNLDKYVWEEVCAWQKSRIERGLEILPVSVNVSRVDVYAIDLVKHFSELLEKYELPRTCIKLEITESTYAEDDDKIGKIAEGLRKEGFSVYLDDFGSGYSSLNMLKNVYVDALKIDMQFLDMDETNAQKGESIMESVINMARILHIPIIVEGAETEREIQSLMNMGCNYVQGFYYYRPMPLEDFEALLETKEVDYSGVAVKQLAEPVHVREFIDENIFTDTMINNIMGAVAFYEVHEDKVELTRVNEQFFRVMHIENNQFEQYKSFIQADVYKSHQDNFREILEEAYENPESGTECNYVGRIPSGQYIYLHIRAFFLKENEGHRVFYVGFTDLGNRIIKR